MRNPRWKRLTDRQREIFEYIARYIAEHQMPPVFREISGHFGFSEKAAFDHINTLTKKGYIEYEIGKPRTIRLTRHAQLFSITAAEAQQHLGIQSGDLLTISPVECLVEGDTILTTEGHLAEYQKGQQVVGKVISRSRPL